MSGIAGAEEYADRIRRQDACPQCGVEEGQVGVNGKIVRGMKVAQAVHGFGVVLWCSETCRVYWLEEQQVRLP